MRRRRPPPDAPGSSAASWAPAAPVSAAMPSLTASSARNRTAEFATIVEAARAARAKAGTAPPPRPVAPPPGVPPPARSDFTRLAALVSGDIAQTSVKLSKLTALAKRRSLFDDPTAEIQELTFVIKQDLGALNARLEDLQRLRDATRRSSNKQAGAHSENVVDSLKTRLGATAEGFKSVLKMRTESLAAQQDRRSQFMGSSASAPFGATAPSASGGMTMNGNAVALDLGGGSLGASGSSMSAGAGMGVMGGGGGQALTLMRPPQDVSYQDARADAVRQVESTIVELGQIFNQLATMVSEQGELVERIDANVDETVSNMDAGQNQLLQYYNSISGNRALILKVFGTLLLFLILWSVIL
jgi:syntaxin 5